MPSILGEACVRTNCARRRVIEWRRVCVPVATATALLGVSSLWAEDGGEYRCDAQSQDTAAFAQEMASVSARPPGGRPVTVEDVIDMTKLADRLYAVHLAHPGSRVAQFSPDGKRFAVVLRKGNLRRNRNDYSLLLWRSDLISTATAPRVLLTMSSSSNLDAIADVSWLPDNQTIMLLGERPGRPRQVYTVNANTGVLRQLTHHRTSVLSYTRSRDGDRIAYTAERSFESIWNQTTRTQGLVVTGHWLHELILGRQRDHYRGDDAALFILDRKGTRQLRVSGGIRGTLNRPYISPDGRYVVIDTDVRHAPGTWAAYSGWLLDLARKVFRNGPLAGLNQYELVATESQQSRVLLDAPAPWPPEVVWAPDSKSVALSHMYLPLDGVATPERDVRARRPFSVEMTIPDGRYEIITDEDLTVSGWDQHSRQLAFDSTGLQRSQPGTLQYFERRGGQWGKLNHSEAPSDSRPQILLEENMQTPPRIVAADPSSKDTSVLLDLNPQFKGLRFGKVEEIRWKGPDGHSISGGLYYPVDYVQGTKYPLVIQTHGWDPTLFWIDGPTTTAFAAQPLAGKGIMVLQADESFGPADVQDPKKEIDRETATLESAIDDLDARGLIDRNRVGVIGWSRTCLFVKYALAHSRYHFAAASVTDGEDGGYLQYITNNNYYVDPSLYGGPPFGRALTAWIQEAPGFSVDRVQTPLRITVVNPAQLLAEWEWFAAMTYLSKSVEMVLLQDGMHMLQRPSERMVSQGGTVDWFAFWLKGEEDPDPAKAEQYARWRELRERYQRQTTADTASARPASQ
jgi:dipeptidyl aminopeptidase/acylaminoacyl peptidase